ncbi:MAG: hypothetical protein ACYTBZ_25765, partial [Planctomycetota bacterium]
NEMVIFDTSRTGYEQYLLPWRIQKYYGIDTVSLSFMDNRNAIPAWSEMATCSPKNTNGEKLGQPRWIHSVISTTTATWIS